MYKYMDEAAPCLVRLENLRKNLKSQHSKETITEAIEIIEFFGSVLDQRMEDGEDDN